MSSINIPRASTADLESTPLSSLGVDEPSCVLQNFRKLNAFERSKAWRPSYHLQAPRGWMNDPCAPFYNTTTGLYHVSFQWNAQGNDWGNISWCSATSHDMLNWTIDCQPSLAPDQRYDCEGVFTGCMVPGRDGSLNYFYTSVSSLPIHHTLSHLRGSESLSMASSHDNGKTWTKSLCNPILPCEPAGFDVTGWRDPYVARWPKLSAMLGVDNEKTLFGFVSGGIRNLTPTSFLYAVDSDCLTSWDFIGPIGNFGFDKGCERWSGDLGRNWEVTNFVCDLKDETDAATKRDFLVMGTEGCESSLADNVKESTGLTRPNRSQLWMCGSLHKYPGGVTFVNEYGGYLDHGCMYAANSFYDPKSQRQIVWGWIPEDDLSDDLRYEQGWSGMLSLPRELRLQTLERVVSAWTSNLRSISSIELEPDRYGSYTMRTLGSEPCPAVVQALRQGPNVRHRMLSRTGLDTTSLVGFSEEDAQALEWQLDCSFQLSKGCHSVGVRIKHSQDPARSTALSFNPHSEIFTIQRPAFSHDTSAELINRNPESASHTLFTMRDPDTGRESTEPLEIRAWRDNSVLEVFANGRTAISTRLYAAGPTCGMEFFAVDGTDANAGNGASDVGDTTLIYASLWDGIGRQSKS